MNFNNKLHHIVPDEHLTLIGDITVSFTQLEYIIKSVIGSTISNNQNIGNIITAELSFKASKALLVSLFKQTYGIEDLEYTTLKNLINRASRIEAQRNSIIHSIWGANFERTKITRIKKTAKESKGLSFTFEEISTEYLQKLCDSIKELSLSFQNLQTRLIKRNNNLK